MTARRRWATLLALALAVIGGLWWWARERRSPAGATGTGDAREPRAAEGRVGSRELRRWAADPGAALASVSGTVQVAVTVQSPGQPAREISFVRAGR